MKKKPFSAYRGWNAVESRPRSPSVVVRLWMSRNGCGRRLPVSRMMMRPGRMVRKSRPSPAWVMPVTGPRLLAISWRLTPCTVPATGKGAARAGRAAEARRRRTVREDRRERLMRGLLCVGASYPRFRRAGPRSSDQVVIVRVRADPEPGNRVFLQEPEGTPTSSDSHRIERLLIVDLLEVEAGMGRILSPEPIAPPSVLLDPLGKLVEQRDEIFCDPGFQRSSTGVSLTRPARMSARTLAANFPSCSWER